MSMAKITFWNVGQGLCHTANLGKYFFMYDCGSVHVPEIEKSIRRIKRLERKNTIDLLIISHFHFDHISGLDYLLSEFSVKKVILPYVEIYERLLIILGSSEYPAWYSSFLTNPVGFLRESEVQEIVVMRGDDPSPEGSFESLGNPDLPLEPQDFRWINKKTSEMKKINSEDSYSTEYAKEPYLILDHQTSIVLQNTWLLKFFNKSMPPEKMATFKAALNNFGLNSMSIIQSAISSPVQLADLQSIYKHLAKDINLTTLCLYHGLLKADVDWFDIPGKFPYYFPLVLHAGTMLTGDFPMFRAKNAKEFLLHYRDYMRFIQVYLLPHHGSKTSWHNLIMKALPRYCQWLFCVSERRIYNHPNHGVLKEMLSNGLSITEVNEKRPFRYHVHFS